MITIDEPQGRTHGGRELSAEFDVLTALHKVKGQFIEIGGPTQPHYVLETPYLVVDTKKLPKPLITTNITPATKVFEPDYETGEYSEAQLLPTQVQIDGRQLAFADNSVGAVFASALPVEIRGKVLVEAYRVLEPGGVLIWQYPFVSDLHSAVKVGFSLKKSQQGPGVLSSFVFQK
ncbi:methyltransferase domain-containing protein [Candidatus Woesebacteria bacterium]|nr:methyltransferase domain-containing protein [Candidatus Woesebacteria bacterium]